MFNIRKKGLIALQILISSFLWYRSGHYSKYENLCPKQKVGTMFSLLWRQALPMAKRVDCTVVGRFCCCFTPPPKASNLNIRCQSTSIHKFYFMTNERSYCQLKMHKFSNSNCWNMASQKLPVPTTRQEWLSSEQSFFCTAQCALDLARGHP